MAKAPILTHCPGMSLKKEEYYGPEDLTTGKRISIFGRDCLIYDADEFTKAYYRAVFDIDLIPV